MREDRPSRSMSGDVETGRRILTARAGACAVDYQILLRMLRKEYRDQRVVILLDKASRHTAQVRAEHFMSGV